VVGIVGVPVPGTLGLLGNPVPEGGISVLPGLGITGMLGFILSMDASGLVGLIGADSLDGIASVDGVVASAAGFFWLVPEVVRFLAFLTLFLRALLVVTATVETCEDEWWAVAAVTRLIRLSGVKTTAVKTIA
jgi:hypothetical protein